MTIQSHPHSRQHQQINKEAETEAQSQAPGARREWRQLSVRCCWWGL